jgi:hypothetical protein
MAGAIPTAFRLFRSQTSPVDFRGGVETVSGNGLVLGGWVDFDAMGERFRSVIGGASQSAFGDGGHLRLRIGGTYGVVDGDLALDLEAAAAGFGAFSVSQVITNVWSGIRIVKVTGWGWTTTFSFAGLDLVPVG